MSVAAPAVEAGFAIREPAVSRAAQQLFKPSGSTLEDTVLGAWEDLTANGRATCPVCTGELESGGCGSCGSELS